MAKFCKFCGTPLHVKSGLCPKCNKEKIPKSQTIEYFNSNTHHLKSKMKPIKRKKKNIGLRIASILLVFVIIFSSLSGVLAYRGVISSKIIDSLFRYFNIEKNVASVERNNNETCCSDFVIYQSKDENIVYDLESGSRYVNNELLITLDSADSKRKLENVLSASGAKIIGEITDLAEYQVLFDKIYDYDELLNFCSHLKKHDWVISASLNYAMEIDIDYKPNDILWKNEWGDVADGTNWGLEAISAQEAWDQIENMQTVNIGVIDSMFDLNNQDLEFAETPLGMEIVNSELQENRREWCNHGTHTSGTIAAIFDNKKGISGIVPELNLYGVSIYGLGSGSRTTIQAYKIALYYLIVTNNCKVINISMGSNLLSFNASRGSQAAISELEKFSSEISDFLQILIDLNYEFVICKAAGNQNETGGPYKYFERDSDDKNTPYDYYSYSDLIACINGEEGFEHLERYKNRIEEINARVESGNVDANFDCFAAITNKNVRDRIIVVGAIKNNGTHVENKFLWFGKKVVSDGYSIAEFSQCGDAVDVLAPGVDIYSTVKNSYQNMSGTSMAAPHVSGVAGLVFSVNPDLDGKAVKEIICSNTDGKYGEDGYGIVNAKKAVDKALSYDDKEEEKHEKEENAFAYAKVIEQYEAAIENDFYENNYDQSSIGKYVSGMLLNISRYYNDFKVYYALSDINKDGVDELVIGGAEDIKNMINFDIFTYDGKKVVPLFNVGGFGERTNFEIYNNGAIYVNGSGGASLHSYEYYKLPANTVTLESVDRYKFEDYVYYRIDEDGNHISVVSEEDFKSIQSNYKAPQMALNWIQIKTETENKQTSLEDKLFYRYIKNNLTLSTGFPLINSNNRGVFSAFIKDFDKDGKKEMMTFSVSNSESNRNSIVLDLYVINNGKVERVDTSDELELIGSGAYQINLCCVSKESVVQLLYSSCGYGGSTITEKYLTYSVKNKKLHLGYDYFLHEFYRQNTYSYVNNAGGYEYTSAEDFMKAVEASYFDLYSHSHWGYEDAEFDVNHDDYTTAKCFKGNHIFSLVDSHGMLLAGERYGFIHDNTELAKKIK